ncbi:hypothetical protein [Citrobacter phage Tr1]|nr:hypothetical protein [Citrobacter phage Tr1]
MVETSCTASKVCFKCGAEKPLTEFYKHKGMADGHLNKCKTCAKTDVKENREDNTDYYKEYDKKRDQTPERKQLKKDYVQGKGKEVAAACKRRWIENNPKKRSVHIKTGNAIRDGVLIKDCCEVCGSSDAVAHHCDYDKPLEITWLCPLHHTAWHQEHGEGLNAI